MLPVFTPLTTKKERISSTEIYNELCPEKLSWAFNNNHSPYLKYFHFTRSRDYIHGIFFNNYFINHLSLHKIEYNLSSFWNDVKKELNNKKKSCTSNSRVLQVWVFKSKVNTDKLTVLTCFFHKYIIYLWSFIYKCNWDINVFFISLRALPENTTKPNVAQKII